MLSVSAAGVHRTIRPKTPASSPSPPSKANESGNHWDCQYRVITKRRCRPSSARKKIIQSIGDDAPIAIHMHCQTMHFDETPLMDPLFVEKKSEDDCEVSSLFASEEIPCPVLSVPFVKSSQGSREAEENKIESFDAEGNKKKNEFGGKTGQENILDTERMKLENDEAEKKQFALSALGLTAKAPVLSSRMSNAVKFLQTKKSYDYQTQEDYLNPGIVEEGVPKSNKSSFPAIMEDNGWESDAEISKLSDLQEPVATVDSSETIENDGIFNDPIAREDEPYYMVGLPNPPGENRCWLNATLHALFSVPLIDYIDPYERQKWRDCSRLTKTFMVLKLFWSQGKKEYFYKYAKLFKENLGILDESYPSQRQQDVSEFLTMFLNYLKTDFEKFVDVENNSAAAMRNVSEDTENMTNNGQETRETPRSPHTPSKRTPLADISPRKRNFHEINSDGSVESSPKIRKTHLTYTVRDLMSPRVNRLSNNSDPMYKVHTPPHNRDKAFLKEDEERINLNKNPIDRYFLLHMMEHYVCKGCAKHRQRKVDNLMIYIDLMHGSEDEIVSLDKSIKNTRQPEERTLTCGKCNFGKHKVFSTFRLCPKYLMVQINRYGMSNDGSVAKFNTPVEIPETLQLDLGMSDLENGNEATENFEPVCVIAHVGSAMDCGHYTSYVKHEDSWFHYNDLVVTPMLRHEALSAAQTTAACTSDWLALTLQQPIQQTNSSSQFLKSRELGLSPGDNRHSPKNRFTSLFLSCLSTRHEKLFSLRHRKKSCIMYKNGPPPSYDEPPPSAPPSYFQSVGGVPPASPFTPAQTYASGPTILTTIVPLGPGPTHTICPQCHSEIDTATKTEPGMIAYISGMLIALLGCFLGCCLIPCCIDECMDIHHTCPNCKTYLGRHRR